MVEDPVISVQRLIDEYRARKMKCPDAIAAAAKWFGMKPRRVSMIRNKEVVRLRPDEYQSIRDGWDRYLDHRAANLAMELKALQARKAAR